MTSPSHVLALLEANGTPGDPSADLSHRCTGYCGRAVATRGLMCEACRPSYVARARAARLDATRKSIPKEQAVRFGAGYRCRPSDLEAHKRRAIGGRMILITGAPKSGKTMLACAMLAHLCDVAEPVDAPSELFARACRARFMSAFALAVAPSRWPLGDGAAPEVTTAMTVPLLVLDNLGGEPTPPSSPITEIIHHRHERNLITWTTTASSPEALNARYGGGTVRRLGSAGEEDPGDDVDLGSETP